MKLLLKVFLCVAALAFTTDAGAADWPDRPIKLIVGFAPGGTADLAVRQAAPVLSKVLGQPVVVTNLPGSGGGTMAMTLKNSDPDGYTLGINPSGAFTLNPLIGAKYTLDDFTFIAGMANFQEGFACKPDRPYNTLAELLDWAKANNQAVNVAVQSQPERMLLRILSNEHGVKFNMIPTQGGSNAITSLLGDHCDFAFFGGLHYNYVKTGQLKCLASAPQTRTKLLPDTPTLAEQGIPFDISQYLVVAAPKGLPDAIRSKLDAALNIAVADSEFVDLLNNKLSMQAMFIDHAMLMQRLQANMESYSKMIELSKEQ